jgi:hypothetical protein
MPAAVYSIYEAQTLISDYLDEVWDSAGARAKKPTFEEVFNIKNMDRGESVNYRTSGLGQFVQREELEDIEYDQLDFGEKQTIRPKNWARGFMVSEEVTEDVADSKGMGDDSRAKVGTYADVVSQWRRSANWTIENYCADLILNGTSTATDYVGRDSVALFGTHTTLRTPTTSQSNLATHASLSANTVQTMITNMDTQLDDKGDFANDEGEDYLVVGPTNDFRAYEITRTKGQVDTMNNNVNPLGARTITPIVWKYLGATHAGYYLLRKGVHSLTWEWRKKPVFGRDGDFDKIAMKFRSRFRGARYFKDWRGIIGDVGV